MPPLVVPGNFDSLSRIGEHVLQVAAEAGLDKKRAYRLRLAIDEIATNIVEHGYGGQKAEGELSVRNEMTQDSLVVILEDTSPAFDPRGLEVHEEAQISQPLEERPVGQLGILLALRGVDEFDYQSTPQGNRSLFLMHRPKETNDDDR